MLRLHSDGAAGLLTQLRQLDERSTAGERERQGQRCLVAELLNKAHLLEFSNYLATSSGRFIQNFELRGKRGVGGL